LKPADGGALPSFKPGQYVTVKLNGLATPTSPRNYSLSDRPGLEYFRISVKREPSPTPQSPVGLVSNYLHDRIEAGDAIDLGPPCGEFHLDPSNVTDRPVVLVSGGIGITPVLSMLKTLAHNGVSSPVHFIHAARNSSVHALGDEVRNIAAERPNIRAHFCYDSPLDEDIAEERCHSTGFIDVPLLEKLLPGNDADFYFCGPKPFMTGLYRSLQQWGVKESHLHFEFFGPKEEMDAVS
jgi:nitric oxide dioxygenase